MTPITDKINLTLIAATASAVIYMFTTFASASDVERIEVRLLKADIREMRRELSYAENERYKESLREDIAEAIAELCEIRPNDRECK